MRVLVAALAACISAPAAAQSQAELFTGAVILDRSIPGNADQGGDAFKAGGRLGFMHPIGPFRVGAEAEGWLGNLRSSSGDLRYRFHAHGGAGAFARVGYEAANGVRPYFRAGAATLFPEMRVRPAVGVGVEAPFLGAIMRVDLSMAGFDHSQAWAGTVGLGWRW